MSAEDKNKISFARRKAVSWQKLKKALKLLFERRLGAEISEMRFMVTSWPPKNQALIVVYSESMSLSNQCCSLRWTKNHSSVQAGSWTELASTLEAGAREGESFSIGRETVFGPEDSIERALVDADLLYG